jgi:CHRD domain-containing protein
LSKEAIMKRWVSLLALTTGAFGLGILAVQPANAQVRELRVQLSAANEVPIVISDATGEFVATGEPGATSFSYDLTYSGLEGTVTQAHIHVGQPFTAGGISIWLCANNPPITNAPAGTQPCPASPGKISGTISAADVVGPTGQAIPAGAFADFLEAAASGNAYVNVHSTSAPGGEIRGQIR